jgi:hypothetical protein
VAIRHLAGCLLDREKKTAEGQGSLRQLLRTFFVFRRFGVFKDDLFSLTLLYHKSRFSSLKFSSIKRRLIVPSAAFSIESNKRVW